MDTAIVILNYNGKKYLKDFLPAVMANSNHAKVYVADNQSTDDSVAFLKSNYPEVTLIINPSNGGFATGYNQALQHVPEKYYVLLNSDIEVTPNWLAPCIELLASDEKIAAVQPKILSYKQKTHFEHAGAAGGYLDKNYYPFCKGRIFEVVEEDKGQYDQESEIFWATGACMVVKAELYHEMGGLDDDFFAHMEEIDLCWRLKKRGYKLMYTPKSFVYHVGGGTLDYMNPKKTYLNFRNSLYMIVKNHEHHLFTKIFYRLILDGIAAMMFLVKFQFKHFAAVFKAHISLYANWKKLMAKRKIIKSESTTFNKAGLYKKSIVTQKFIKKTSAFSKLNPNDFYN
ncbi:glycosyltransferase family 2 protein [Putridiphycobacter roseus]|uniref:Glycosyltransferase family 2 protein n=1 Tax=Putridiphycobacter roseus TaxID=2219161 RepID=A0A2W1NK90_9FLAO|nr:glycosyltransferase family 2 protein [Putridiphycobacter roseus]PZE16072.1 glycosyltransferase family 2 protein [Putridiphycobacter roseus]